TDAGEQARDLLTGLSILGELGEGTARFENGILQLSELLAFGEGFRKGLSVDPFQFRFKIETLEVRRAAGHAEVNYALSSHRKIRRIDNASPAIGRGRGFGDADQLRVQQAGEGHAAQTVSGTSEEGATANTQLKLALIK